MSAVAAPAANSSADATAPAAAPAGLSDADAAASLLVVGPNELPSTEVPLWRVFVSHFTNPLAVLLWAAISVEVVQYSIEGSGWLDWVVLLLLQLLNGLVGFLEESNASRAVAALRASLAAKATVLRGGQWRSAPARELVPDDLVRLHLGDIVPADCVVVAGELRLDASALTGESLPVRAPVNARALMTSIVREGEASARVVSTGPRTFVGRAAELVGTVEHTSQIQLVMLRVLVLTSLLAFLVGPFVFVALIEFSDATTFLFALGTTIAVVIAGIPLPMAVVVTSTLAIASRELSHKKVIVARLSAIEELAALTTLCSDKTGTLTLNQLQMREPAVLVPGLGGDDVLLVAALASRLARSSDTAVAVHQVELTARLSAPTPAPVHQDAIDACVEAALPASRAAALGAFVRGAFRPFTPATRRSECDVVHGSGPFPAALEPPFTAIKGSPAAVLCECAEPARAAALAVVQELADRGFRALAVAVRRGDSSPVEIVGVLSLYDPPRPDSAATIKSAQELGVRVVIISGDHELVVREVAQELGLCGRGGASRVISCAAALPDDHDMRQACAFSDALPESKFDIVSAFRGERGALVGMTGDGVNDAPALKRADVGIAVAGATDAARAAADIVLTAPGLHVIIDGIRLARRVFSRVRAYIVYRVATTITLSLFFFLAALTIVPSAPFNYGSLPAPTPALAHSNVFVLPVLQIVILVILGDIVAIFMSRDNVAPLPTPAQWHLGELAALSFALAIPQIFGAVIFLVVVLHANAAHAPTFVGRALGANGAGHVTEAELYTAVFLELGVSSILLLLVARTERPFWASPRPSLTLLAAAAAAIGLLVVFALFFQSFFGNASGAANLSTSTSAVFFILVFCIIVFVLTEAVKALAVRTLPLLFSPHAEGAARAKAAPR